MSNALLARYRAEGAAGGFSRVKDSGSVAFAMREHSNQYGPSQASYDHWKRSGIPTNETMQSTTFGLSTRKGDSAGDAMTFSSAAPAPMPQQKPHQLAAQNRANPITWMGGPPDMSRPLLNGYANAAADMAAYENQQFQQQAMRQMPPPLQMQQPPEPQLPNAPPNGGPLSPVEMQQTWSTLMRTGKVKPTAAQCLVEMPPEYSTEDAPKPPPISSQSLMTIGLHDHNLPVRRSTHFTKDFRDPFM